MPEAVQAMEPALSPSVQGAPNVMPQADHIVERVVPRRAEDVFLQVLAARRAESRRQQAEALPRERSEVASRTLNVIVAAVGLLLAMPLLGLIAILVKATSRGPIFYKQTRVGVDRRYRLKYSHDRRVADQGGRPFTMYKFRTMRVDAEADGRAVWAAKQDRRVTPIGATLRRLRLDELPQLYNVLRGDMNIVGPRPERPSIFAELRTEIPEYHLRQLVKPGITGWAQVNQAYDTSLDDVRNKVRLDLEYLRRQSLLEDVRIMTMTLPVMLFRRGGW
jgi:lipopolysaccharide/colanic/teichoic acid biosynthesis glycosyltransferase